MLFCKSSNAAKYHSAIREEALNVVYLHRERRKGSSLRDLKAADADQDEELDHAEGEPRRAWPLRSFAKPAKPLQPGGTRVWMFSTAWQPGLEVKDKLSSWTQQEKASKSMTYMRRILESPFEIIRDMTLDVFGLARAFMWDFCLILSHYSLQISKTTRCQR